MTDLAGLSQGFRQRYLPFADLEAQVHAWQHALPELVRLTSIGRSVEGRDLWLLTIGRDPDRIRPAAWVDANIHASELCGSSVALAIAEDALRLHLGETPADLPGHLCALLRDDVLLYVLPRMCPDGAERVLGTARFVRSNPRERRQGYTAPYWRHEDVDGDGLALLMRRQEPSGDYVESADFPGLMLPRRIEDAGPFYALYPEGVVEGWDGFHVPAPSLLSDNDTDMNRNFPYGWRAEPHQPGAGAFATSEPESRAVAEFATAHPEIFAWLSLHTFGGVYIRPSGHLGDKAMDQSDLALFHQIAEWGERYAGYPSVSGFEEFTYEPDKPLCGDLASFAYEQRGAAGLVCELWDFWKQSGLEVKRPFVMNFLRRTREDALTIARWDQAHNAGRIVGKWRPFEHPQLGAVEVGGYDPRIGIWNPPPDRLDEVCQGQVRVFLRMAALAPRLRLRDFACDAEGEGLTRIAGTVENIGYLPTYVLGVARSLPWNEAVRVEIEPGPGVELRAGERVRRIGHLEGWGGFHKWSTPVFARSWNEPPRRRVEWVVRGQGVVLVRATSARLGAQELTLEVGAARPASARR